MTCASCGHERHYHFVVDQDGHSDEMRCSFFFGSGKFRCTCDGWEEDAHASA